jgi:hypothetical protein
MHERSVLYNPFAGCKMPPEVRIGYGEGKIEQKRGKEEEYRKPLNELNPICFKGQRKTLFAAVSLITPFSKQVQ